MDKKKVRRIFLADDQTHIRSALRLILEQEPALTVVGEAADAIGLLASLEASEADLVLFDWELPGLPGAQLVRLLHYERPRLRIVAMSSRPEARPTALQAGVSAFLSKGAPPEVVLCTLRRLAS